MGLSSRAGAALVAIGVLLASSSAVALKYYVPPRLRARVVASDDRVIVAFGGRWIELDRATGHRLRTEADPTAGGLIALDGVTTVVREMRGLTAFDSETQSELWRIALESSFASLERQELWLSERAQQEILIVEPRTARVRRVLGTAGCFAEHWAIRDSVVLVWDYANACAFHIDGELIWQNRARGKLIFVGDGFLDIDAGSIGFFGPNTHGWRREIAARSAVLCSGRLFAMTRGDEPIVYAFEPPAASRPLWSTTLSQSGEDAELEACGDDSVIARIEETRLAIDRDNGKQLWRSDSRPIRVNDGLMLLAREEGAIDVRLVDERTLEPLWEFAPCRWPEFREVCN
jgi:hypothetical protein